MKICVGIPCYDGVSAETLSDYMRFMYYLGRRVPDHEFYLAIKSKSEQFRARNSIVEVALQVGADYLLFLDDDQVIDWEESPTPNTRYGFIQTLIDHLEEDATRGIVGALYYHRGGQCRPVVMKEGREGGYYWMRDDEITNNLQEVAVTGGGCMLIKLKIFDKIKAPWFEPEFDLGTDVQICKKASEAGYSTWCDTSIKIGHVMSSRMVITPNNRHKVSMEKAKLYAGGNDGMDSSWLAGSSMNLYVMDAEEYLGMQRDQMNMIAIRYDPIAIKNHEGSLDKYYGSRGDEQLARQVMFHSIPSMVDQYELFLSCVNTQADGYGVDVGCGSAPIGFELAMRGHRMDFIDIDGAGAYEFTKWRAKKRNINAGFQWAGPYDYALMMDSIEHFEDLEGMLAKTCASIKDGGALLTNYFWNTDVENPEHINMNQGEVKDILMNNGFYPLSDMLWTKRDLGFMDRADPQQLKEVGDEKGSISV